jgi:hypothetical protein
MKWPRISGNTYNNGMEVSNEMATMSNSDIWLSVIILYKYYNSCVYVYVYVYVYYLFIWETRPLAESNRFGKSAVGRKYSV